MKKRVFLAGEGPTDIGCWARDAAYRDGSSGVVGALLEKAAACATWEVVGGVKWTCIRKYKAGAHRSAEQRNVRGAALMAHESGADVLVFARDRDRDEQRERDVEAGLRELEASGQAVVGGIASQAMEAWVLAARGERGSEEHAKPKNVLNLGIEDMLSALRASDLDQLPEDAESLRRWLDRARRVFVEPGQDRA